MSEHEPHETPIVHEEPDEWHLHTPVEGRPQREHGARARPAILAAVLVAMVLSVLMMGLGVVVYFDWYVTRLKSDRAETISAGVQAREKQQNARIELSEYGWVDRDAGTVRVPLDRAKRLVVEDYGRMRPSGD